jgi:excisionase family DNA binding protein
MLTEPEVPILLTISEAALLLRCSERHIRRQLAAGTLPGVVQLGRLYRIDQAKLLAGAR